MQVRKRTRTFTCLFCLLFIITARAATAEKITFTDDLGQQIHLTQAVTRIISLYSAHTENLYSLGLDEEIIGVGRVDRYPAQALEKPRFDYRSDPEKVIASDPDLVLIRPFIKRSHPEFVSILEQVGIPVVALYPDTFEEFDAYIRKLSILTGKEEQAEELLQEFHQKLAEIRSITQNVNPKVSVYFESVEKGYKTVSPGSLPARAIAIAGGINIAREARAVKPGSSIASYGIERLLEGADDIDVYIVQQGAMHAGTDAESITKRPGFRVIKAVKEGRVHTIDEKLISSPTFRYIQGIQELAHIFYPALFDSQQ